MNFALRVDRITPKEAIKYSPLYLFYVQQVILPIQLEIPSLKLIENIEQEELIINQNFKILELEENKEVSQKYEIKIRDK